MGKGSKLGRSNRNQKKARYQNTNRRFKNKLKRVRQSCGEDFAVEWERAYAKHNPR